MDNFLRQKRSKYPEPRHDSRQQQDNRRETYLPPQNSQSFREKKKTVSWLGRQFSRQMSRGSDFSDDGIERATAIAAAIFAIRSVEESEIVRPKKKVDHHPETSSFPKTKNLEEDTRAPPPHSASEPKAFPRFADKDVLRDIGEEGSSDRKKKVTVISDQQKPKPTERTASFSGNKPDISGTRRTEPELKPVAVPIIIPRPPTPPISRKPSTEPIDTKKPSQTQTKPSSNPTQTKADLWEKAEMAKIKERYHKVNETISYWENKKREKATRKLQESQSVGVKKKNRDRGRRKFEEDMEFIKQIAGEARTKADRKRRNDILKANQKADVIRQTGDLPVTCCCYC